MVSYDDCPIISDGSGEGEEMEGLVDEAMEDGCGEGIGGGSGKDVRGGCGKDVRGGCGKDVRGGCGKDVRGGSDYDVKGISDMILDERSVEVVKVASEQDMNGGGSEERSQRIGGDTRGGCVDLKGGNEMSMRGGSGEHAGCGGSSSRSIKSINRGGSRKNVRGGSGVNMRGGSGVNMRGGSGVNMRGGSGVNMRGGSGVNMRGGSGVNMRGGSDVNMRGGSDVNMRGGSGVNMKGGSGVNMRGGRGGGVRHGCLPGVSVLPSPAALPMAQQNLVEAMQCSLALPTWLVANMASVQSMLEHCVASGKHFSKKKMADKKAPILRNKKQCIRACK